MLPLEDIVIDDEFRNLLPSIEDPSLLKAKIESEDWSDEPITVWMNHGILLDGHRRYEIWKERGDDGPQVRELKFSSREEAYHWIVNHQCARRNLTPEQERYLLGRKYTAEKGVSSGAPKGNQNAKKQCDQSGHIVSGSTNNTTRKRLAKDLSVGETTVARSERYANAVDDLDARGVVSKSDILSGAVKVPASKVVEAAKTQTNEEAKAVLSTATKGGTSKKKTERKSDSPQQSKAKTGDDANRTDKQREIAVVAYHEVIDYLIRSPLVRLGVTNPHREYAYKRVIGWLRSNLKDKSNVKNV